MNVNLDDAELMLLLGCIDVTTGVLGKPMHGWVIEKRAEIDALRFKLAEPDVRRDHHVIRETGYTSRESVLARIDAVKSAGFKAYSVEEPRATPSSPRRWSVHIALGTRHVSFDRLPARAQEQTSKPTRVRRYAKRSKRWPISASASRRTIAKAP